MLNSRTLIILFLFSTVLQFSYGSSHEHRNATESRRQPFEALIFAQHWPVSVCVENIVIAVPFHNCVLPKGNQLEWTIHGIWPTRFYRMGPSLCNKTLYLNESALYPILPQLEVKWRNVLIDTPKFSFWKSEWEKHGTCAIDIPELNTQLKYFQKALDLQNVYDMTRILAKAGILPGQNYTIQKIIDGVQKILGKTIQIQCVKNEKTRKSYLLDIRICLDKSFKLIHCNGIVVSSTNCDRSMPVNYPGTIPSSQSTGIHSTRQIKNQIPLLLCTYIFEIYSRF